MKKQQDKYDILKTYYGYDTFRDGQEELIDCLLNGQVVCGIMPTGAGKSVCYQVPALLLPHVTLVVSPLISLMKDQVRALNQMGVHAAYLNSSLSWNQYKKALAYAKEGRYKIIYVAPERLLTEDFLDFAASTPISLLAVDEAHCVSQWGQDFRPSYLRIVQFIDSLPKRPVVGAGFPPQLFKNPGICPHAAHPSRHRRFYRDGNQGSSRRHHPDAGAVRSPCRCDRF